MDGVLQCVMENQNGLLESPTGTGKTLSLLTSILGYMKANPKKNHQLVYLSRMHTQVLYNININIII